MAELIVHFKHSIDITGAVQDANDLDAVGDGAVKDQMVLELPNSPAP